MSKLIVKVIGSGGIGTKLLPELCRVLNFGSPEYDFDDADVCVIDGDTFEEKNRSRQAFRERGNKAEVVVEELKKDFVNIGLTSKSVYVTEKNVAELICEDDLVLIGVDNHNVRRVISQHCRKLNNVVVISGGNELEDGNVMVMIRKDGDDFTLPLDSDKHPEIQNPDDENPGDKADEPKPEGCIEMQESAPQLSITNMMVAAHMMGAIHAHLKGVLDYDELFFDMRTGKSRPVYHSNSQAASLKVKLPVKAS